MEIREYLNIVKKRLMLILVITLLFIFTSAVFSYIIIKPQYKADISVIIGKSQATQTSAYNYNDLVMYEKLVKTYSLMANSRKVMEDVKQKLNIDLSVGKLISMVSVSPNGDTQFLTIAVKSSDPQLAQKIANQIAISLAEESKAVLNEDNVHILDQALLPEKPDSPKPALNMAIALFLGLMVSVGIVFLVEYLDNTVKNQDEIERLIGVPVIGIIPVVEAEE